MIYDLSIDRQVGYMICILIVGYGSVLIFNICDRHCTLYCQICPYQAYLGSRETSCNDSLLQNSYIPNLYISADQDISSIQHQITISADIFYGHLRGLLIHICCLAYRDIY